MRKEILAIPIKLKIIEKADAANLHQLRTDPALTRFIARDVNQSISDIEKFIAAVTSDDEKTLFYKIEMISNQELAGTISLKNIDREKKYAEVGYELFTQFQGRGLMSIALDKMIELVFTEAGLEELEAYTHRDNLQSRKLLEKFAFNEVIGKVDGKNLNNVIYSLKKAGV